MSYTTVYERGETEYYCCPKDNAHPSEDIDIDPIDPYSPTSPDQISPFDAQPGSPNQISPF